MRYELANIPDALQDVDRWVLWRDEKRNGDLTKVPCQPSGSKASTTEPDTWTSFETAQDVYVSSDFDGIGFVFTEDGPFVGVDLDGCVKDGDLTGGAWEIVKRLDSYTEGSPSGTGLHIITRGFLPGLGNRSSDVSGLKELELYESARYFTFTGRHLDSTPKIVENRAEEIHDLCKDVFGEPQPEHAGVPSEPNNLDDQELVEKAKQANDGGKFAQLWSGDTSGYQSHSEAQQALANKLAFWTGGDELRMLSLFKDSGMPRGDDDVRKFREYDVKTALDECTEFYEPSAPSTNHRTNGQAEPEELDPWTAVRTAYDTNKSEGRVKAAGQLIREKNLATHRASEELYRWDKEKKVYSDDGEQAIRECLVQELQNRFSQHEVNEILGMIEARTYRDDFGAEGFVPVANGDLKVTADAVELVEATPEHGFRNRSPAKWDPDADAPIFNAYLEQVVKTEVERLTLQEYAGYALMYWALLYHKALFLVGPQASGKSTFLKVLHEMLGKTTQLSPQQLVDQRFGAIELEDSWANIASDIPSALLSNVGRFKEITAGDPIHAERKYQQGYAIEPTAKHFYSANQLPEIKIDDDAFFRRVLIVAFPQTIDRDQCDPNLGEKLRLELDGILRWAVKGLQRLLDNEGFTRDLTPEETRRLWDEHASSIGQFKIRRLDVTGHSEEVEAKQDVYRAYTEFCMDNGLPTESQQKLTRVLKRDPRIGQAKRKLDGWDKRTKCYVGVQLPSEDGEIPF